MKARKFKVNLKSCAGTFFYSHGVLIFGGLFLFFFVFTMDEIKKYCQPGVYVPCFHFSCLYRSMYSINDTQQTFCGFIFAEIPSKNTFISQLVFLLSDLQNGWFLHMLFWSQQDLRSCHIWPLEIMFRPNLACMLLVQCWQPFTMLGLPSGEKGWMYLGQFSYVEIALWASFLQGLVLLHWNWGEFSPCPHWGWARLQSALPLDTSTIPLTPALPDSASLGTSPALSPNLHLPSASLAYPALSAAFPCHLQSQLTLMCCSEQMPLYREEERSLWCAIHCLLALLLCCQFFLFFRLLLLRTRAVLFVSASCHHIEDTDSRLWCGESSVPIPVLTDCPSQL